MLIHFGIPKKFGRMPKKTSKIMEKCGIAFFLSSLSNVTGTENFHRANGWEKKIFFEVLWLEGVQKKLSNETSVGYEIRREPDRCHQNCPRLLAINSTPQNGIKAVVMSLLTPKKTGTLALPLMVTVQRLLGMTVQWLWTWKLRI